MVVDETQLDSECLQLAYHLAAMPLQSLSLLKQQLAKPLLAQAEALSASLCPAQPLAQPLLPVAQEVWRSRSERVQTAQGGESAPEGPGGRFDDGQADPARGSVKRCLKAVLMKLKNF